MKTCIPPGFGKRSEDKRVTGSAVVAKVKMVRWYGVIVIKIIYRRIQGIAPECIEVAIADGNRIFKIISLLKLSGIFCRRIAVVHIATPAGERNWILRKNYRIPEYKKYRKKECFHVML